MRMRAAVLHEPRRPLVIEEVELEPPRDDDVLVRVAAAGVCHSGARLADGELGAGAGRWCETMRLAWSTTVLPARTHTPGSCEPGAAPSTWRIATP